MRPQPLIAVRDVEASSRWYQRLLGCASAHGGPKYERLVAGDRLVMQLHDWDVAVSKASGVIVAHPAVTAA